MAESSLNGIIACYRLGLWRKRTYFYKTKTKIGQFFIQMASLSNPAASPTGFFKL
jgi:hypothetical protein